MTIDIYKFRQNFNFLCICFLTIEKNVSGQFLRMMKFSIRSFLSLFPKILSPEAKFLVPDWGIQLTLAQVCRTGPLGYIGCQAGTTTLEPESARVDYFISRSQGLRTSCSLFLNKEHDVTTEKYDNFVWLISVKGVSPVTLNTHAK